MADSDGFESAEEDKTPSPVTKEPEPDITPAPLPEPYITPAPLPEPDITPAPLPEPDITPAPLPQSAPEPGPQPGPEPGDWGWGSWSTWAATSVSSVAEIANTATQGISGALETFEASLGLPTPEELAREIRETEDQTETETTEEPLPDPSPERPGYYPGAGLWTGLSALSQTGSHYLVSGLEKLEKVSNQGLEKLEQVSSQAYEALNDQTADKADKPRTRDQTKGASLMAVLQEAKIKYEQHEKISAETRRTMSYLFDEKQGLSQLEALEMLSKECVQKMKSCTASEDTSTLFLYIETSLELKSGDSEIIIEHLGAAVTDCLKTMKIDLPITKLNQCRFEIAQSLAEMDLTTLSETASPSHTKRTVTLDTALSSTASFTARSVELFKKTAEMSLLKSSLEVEMKTQADTVKFLNELLCCELENIREQFSDRVEEGDVDRLYLETGNAVSYLQEVLYFYVPIFKWIVVKTAKS